MSASEEVAAVGATQRFECQVVGYPSPIVTWYKDEVDITQDPRYNIHFDKQQGVIALTIREVLPTDEGCYQCRAQNSEGYATTTAYLVVRVDHGLSAGFKSMLVAEKLSEQESSRVQMSSAYKQRVIEEVITRYEESEKEVIEEKLFPPKVTYDHALSEGVQLKAGSTLYIEVGVAGIPFPSVTWKHGETQLREDARVTMEDDPSGYSYLKVKGTTREDEGIYKVMAENTVGKDEASFNVTVKGTPSAPRNLHIQEVYKDYIVIRWDAPEQDGGFPVTSYNIEKSLSGGTFMAVNQVLANEFEFKITRLYEGSEYMFRVSAQNKVGVGVSVTTDKPTKARLPFDPPGKPTDLKVTSVDKDAVGLSWDAPESDGGALVTSYIVERKDVSRASSMWAIAGTVDGTTRDLLVGKLFTGNCYHFRVFSENRVGPGEPATLDDGIVAKLPYDAPSPARNIRAVETNVDYIVLEWDPPESDGGTPLTSYVIEKRDSKRREFIYIADVGPDCTLFKAMRLFEGYEYFFRVFAENIVGPSEACTMETPARAKLPYDEPASPRSLRVTDYWTDFVTVQWEASDYDGGSPITGYIIEKRDAMRQSWIKVGNVGPDIDTFQVTNLFEGTDYVFRVFAENKVGLSLTAAELDKPQRAKMPYDAPLAPQSMTISDVTSESATVMWAPPANDGGAPLTGYVIEKRDAMRISWGVCGTAAPDANTFKVDGLIVGDNYFFRVSAENKVGRGEFVELIHPITAKMPYDKPGPPSNLRTTEVWNNYITIAWDVPEDDGGTPILGYHVELRDAMKAEFREVGKTPANITEFQVGCLEEGREYYFRIFACNKAGVGEVPSDLKPAVKAQLPYDRPSAPTALKVVGTGKGTISITWGLPSNEGGSPVTGYMIEASQAREHDNFKAVGTVEAATLEYTITDLIDGADYFVRVRAQNAAGLSEEAVQTGLPVCAREPRTAPDSPGSVTVTSVTSESVTITWSAPLSDGGAKVRSYTVEVREVGMTFSPAMEVDGNTLTATLPSLTPENAYEIQVFATNSEGPSKPASLAEPVKTEPAPAVLTPPSAPKALRVTEARSDAITITWEEPESDGGSPVTHYVVVIKDDTSTKKFRKAGRVEATTLSLTVTDKIKPGHEYNMVVYGENAAGVSNDGAELATPVMVPEPVAVVEEVFEEVVEMVESAPVQAAAPPKPKAVPAAPENARCDGVSSDGLTVVWDAPENDGGCPVIKYTIVMRDVEKKKFKPIGEVDGTTTSFTVDKVKSGHDYVIRVYAENEVGLSVESEISDAVKIPSEKAEDTVDAKGPAPEIVTAPEPVAVAEGETIRLTCKVKGDPDPEVTWFKGDKKLKASKREPRLKIQWDMVEDLNVLIIMDANADDSGEYTVIAENEHGTYRFTVTVLVGKPKGAEIIKTTESKRTVTTVEETVVDGEVVERTVKSETSEDTPEVTVEKSEIMESVLPVEGIQEDGAAPKFDQPPEPMLVDFGEEIRLTCRVKGDPEPEVTWYKEDQLIKPKKGEQRIKVDWDMKEDLNILMIKDATKEDAGKYTVIADNKFGSFKFSVTVLVGKPSGGGKIIKTTESKRVVTMVEETIVDGEVVERTVNEDVSEAEPTTVVDKITPTESLAPVEIEPAGSPPKFIQPPEPVFVDIGETVVVSCKVEGSPKPDVIWYKENSKIETQDRTEVKYSVDEDIYILIIIDAATDDAGEYTVIAENRFGSSEFTITVEVRCKQSFEVKNKASGTEHIVQMVEDMFDAGELVEKAMKEAVSENLKSSCEQSKVVSQSTETFYEETADRVTSTAVTTESLSLDINEDSQKEMAVVDQFATIVTEHPEIMETETDEITTPDNIPITLDEQLTCRDNFSVIEIETVETGIIAKNTSSSLISEIVTVESMLVKKVSCESKPQETPVIINNTIMPENSIESKPALTTKVPETDELDISEGFQLIGEECNKTTMIEEVTFTESKVSTNDQVEVSDSIIIKDDQGEAPKFSKPPEPVFGDFGEDIILTCQVTGTPVPEITWYKSGDKLKMKTGDNKIKIHYDVKQDLHVLTIMDASISDAADYTVIADNPLGSFKFTVTVLVGRPEGAEIVKKTIESTRSVKVIEETIVDGQVVHRVVTEDLHEDAPKEEIITDDQSICSVTQDVDAKETMIETIAETSTKPLETEKKLDDTLIEKIPKAKLNKKQSSSSSEESSSEISSDDSSSDVSSSDVDEEEPKTEIKQKVKASKKDKIEGEPPKFIQPPEPVFVNVGDTIRLTCKVTGDPEPTVLWYRQDDELVTTADLRIQVEQISDMYTLTIKNATEEDSGEYKVKAANRFGTFNFTVTVLVGRPAGSRIVETTRTTKSVHETIIDGEVVSHEEKEDKRVEKFDNIDSSSITTVTSSDSTTQKQEIIEDIIIDEVVPAIEATKPTDDKSPKFAVPPKPISVEEGETIRLTCQVSGAPEPEVSWYKGDALIKPSKRDTRIQTSWSMADDLNHLTITSARSSDSGEYTARAENLHSQRSVTVSVTVGKPLTVEDKEGFNNSSELLIQEEESGSEETTTLNNEVVNEQSLEQTEVNEDVAIKLQTTEIEPAEQDVSVAVAEDTEGERSVELVLESADTENTMVNTEAVQAESTSEVSSTIVPVEENGKPIKDVDVQKATLVAGAPKLELAPKPVVVDVGETIEISCKFSGDPEPEVTFYKGDKLIKNKKTNKRVRIDWDMKTDLYTLVIQEANAEDAADYVIRAENSHGEIRFTVNVIVGRETIETTHTISHTEKTVVTEGAVSETVVTTETTTETLVDGLTSTTKTLIVSGDVTSGGADNDNDIVETIVLSDVSTAEVTATEEVSTEINEVITTKLNESSVSETIMLPNDSAPNITEQEAVENIKVDQTKSSVVSEEILKSVEDIEVIEVESKTDNDASASDDSSSDSSSSQSESEGEEPDDEGAPTVEQAPEPVNVKLGETICLKCKVTGDPEPEVIWLRDNVEIKQRRFDKRVMIDWDMNQNLYVLTIKEATLKDAGEYAVQASNINGGFTLQVTVVVRDETESSQDVAQTEIATEATIEAYSSDSTSVSKVINQTEVVTNQSVVETISSSGRSEDIAVEPSGAPVMELAPEPTVVKVGGTIRLTCCVKGHPEPTMTWWKGPMPMPANEIRINQTHDTKTGMSTLTIVKASIIDSGKYEVHAENTRGLIIVSVDVIVSDEITELIVEERTSDKIIQDGSNIMIREHASHENAESLGLSVEEIIRRELVDGMKTQGSKSYRSLSSNIQSLPAILEVAPEPQSLTEGDTIRLTCKVSGNPEPTVSWLRGDKSLMGEIWDNRMMIDFVSSSNMHVLTIRNCQQSDAGNYTVIVDNNAGSIMHTVSVNISVSVEDTFTSNIILKDKTSETSCHDNKVRIKKTRFDLSQNKDLGAGIVDEFIGMQSIQSFNQQTTGEPGGPVVENPPQPINVSFGETIRLTCHVTGDPEPDVSWYKGGKQIKTRLRDKRIRVDWDMKTDEQFLEINNATEADAGDYELRAENDKGSTSFTVSVNVGDMGPGAASGYERRVVTTSSSSSSMSSSTLLDDPFFADMSSGSTMFSSRFK